MKILLALLVLNFPMNLHAEAERICEAPSERDEAKAEQDPLTLRALDRLAQHLGIAFNIPFPSDFDPDAYKKRPLAVIQAGGGNVCFTRPIVNPYDQPLTVEWLIGPEDPSKLAGEGFECMIDLDERGDFSCLNLIADWASDRGNHQIIRGENETGTDFFERARLTYQFRARSAKDPASTARLLAGFEKIAMSIQLLRKEEARSVPGQRPNPERFAREIAAFARQQPEKGGIVFTGSSSIRIWPDLKTDFPGLPIVNRGFGGCVANDLIVHFETVVARHEPKLIVAYAGGNDIAEKLTVREAFADYTKFLDLSHQRFPQARIILNSVKIAPVRARQIPQVHELNQLLQTWAADRDWLRYVDATSYLADSTNLPIASYFLEDQLHLNPSGYAKWQAILDPILREEWDKVK